MVETDAFAEKVVEAAARSGYAVAPHLVPSTTCSIGTADWRWLGMCSQLLSLARRANDACASARLDTRISVQLETGRRRLSLHCGDKWLRLNRQRLIGRGHITVERSYRLPAYPPEPADLACLEELVFELVAAAGGAPLV